MSPTGSWVGEEDEGRSKALLLGTAALDLAVWAIPAGNSIRSLRDRKTHRDGDNL